jgi:hypothetical protein
MKRKRQYDPAKDNPLLGDMALLIVGAIAGVVGVGYLAYKAGQSSVPPPTPAATPPQTSSTNAALAADTSAADASAAAVEKSLGI